MQVIRQQHVMVGPLCAVLQAGVWLVPLELETGTAAAIRPPV